MGKQTNGGAKGSLQTQTVTAMKTRSLLTRGEKLIILRNALFDDDPGGFGAERDVTRWLATPFRTYKKNGLDVDIEFAHGESLMGADLGDLLDMAEKFSLEVEEDAGREYNKEDKEEHLTEEAARFLIARDNSDAGKIIGFAHFRFTLHGELADCMEGEPCLFVYDVHVADACQRKGLARHLMTMLELIARKANMSEMVTPVPNSPLAEAGQLFLQQGLKGWAADGLVEVAPKTAKALAEDGTMSVFVKVLKPRDCKDEDEPEHEQAGIVSAQDEEPTPEEVEAVAAAFKGSGGGAAAAEEAEPVDSAPTSEGAGAVDEEDEWAVAAPKAGSKGASSKKGKKSKGNKKKSSPHKSAVAGAEGAASPTDGSSANAPLSV